MKKIISAILLLSFLLSFGASAFEEYKDAEITDFNIDILFKNDISLEFLSPVFNGYKDSKMAKQGVFIGYALVENKSKKKKEERRNEENYIRFPCFIHAFISCVCC